MATTCILLIGLIVMCGLVICIVCEYCKLDDEYNKLLDFYENSKQLRVIDILSNICSEEKRIEIEYEVNGKEHTKSFWLSDWRKGYRHELDYLLVKMDDSDDGLLLIEKNKLRL